MAKTKKEVEGRGGKVLTDKEKIELIKTGTLKKKKKKK